MENHCLGEAKFPSPLKRSVSDLDRMNTRIVEGPGEPTYPNQQFELAGPRERIFFDPAHTRAAIVTCGGLCPGLNNVIRSIFLELRHRYGVQEVIGFRDGYQGLDPHRCK